MTSPGDLRAGKRVPVLDGVRGLAILMVVGYHALAMRHTDPLATTLSEIHGTLWIGVDLFFVLSGFLITLVLLKAKEDARGSYFRRFYTNRTLRIFPLYYATLIVLIVFLPLAILVVGHKQPSFLTGIRNHQIWLWTYMQNWFQAGGPHRLHGLGHFWSLAVEEQFYLVWPFVVLLLSRRRLLQVCIVMPVLCLGLRIALASGGVDGWTIRHLTITRCDTILIGAGLAIAYIDDSLRDRVRRSAPYVTIGAVVGLAAIWTSLGRTSYDKFSLVVTLGFTFTALFSAGLICLSLDHPVLDRSFFRTLGKYSYAMYIFHPVVNAGVHWVLVRTFPSLPTAVPRAVVQFGLTLGLSLVAAMISWSLWESRWLALKRRATPATS